MSRENLVFIVLFGISAIISGISIGYLVNFIKNRQINISALELHFLKNDKKNI